jgi:carbon-monoxide dehydrogenase large subunit
MTSLSMPVVGARLARLEDERLLRGRGRFVADLEPAHTVHAAFVRSPVPHGQILDVGLDVVRDDPRLIAAFCHTDLPHKLANDSGPRQPLLAGGEVTYVGQPIAVVMASDRYVAEDLAEQVQPDIEPLDAVTDIDESLQDHATAHIDEPTNVVLTNDSWPNELDEVIAAAHLVVDAEYRTERQSAMPMETRGVLAVPDLDSGGLTVHTGTQMPHILRDALASFLELPQTAVRIVAPDVGGAFGVKLAVYPEDLVIAIAALRLHRPVKWICDRYEAFTSDYQCRGSSYRATAAFDRDGTWRGLGVELTCPAGAFFAVPWSGAVVETFIGSTSLPGPYRIGHYGYRCRGVLTNTTPTSAYRATGGPAATWITESLMDRAAQRLGIDRVELRRRNMITASEVPFATHGGLEIDTGTHLEALETALDHVGFDDWEKRRAAAVAEGRHIGLGIASYVAPTAAGVMGPDPSVAIPFDSTTVRIEPSGDVTILAGVSSQGQGLETTLAQITADELAIDVGRITVRAGDTLTCPYSGGTHGSRAGVLGGAATKTAAAAVAAKVRAIAGHLLEASPDDIDLAAGQAQVRGVPSAAITLDEIAMRSHLQAQSLPVGMEPGLESTNRYLNRRYYTTANGCHAAIVELLEATGGFRVLDYVVVQDGGVIINPSIVEGQVRGGVAQGVGSVFLEAVDYDRQGGLMTSSLIHYLLPRESDVVPRMRIVHIQSPSEHPGGMRGIGEAGLHAAVAALANAVEDATGHEIDRVPVRPERIADLVSAESRHHLVDE